MEEIPLGLLQNWGAIIGALILSATIIGALGKIGAAVKRVVAPIREYFSEHDVLWEDYNLRTGGTYRRATGRGNPPDPIEFYREHPMGGAAPGRDE